MNTLNQITQLSDSGPIYFAGTVNEPATITVNGVAAKAAPDASNSSQTDFSANIPLSPGTDTVAVAATNGNNVTTTKNYQVTVTDSGVNRTLMYDANGNLTNDGNGKVYAYDAANRLISVTQTVNGVQTITGYVYDGFNHRVQETSNGTVVKQWVWCPRNLRPREERDGSNNVTKRFYPQGEQINGTNYYFTRDHLGSVREMTNASGALIARYDYDPYGRRTLVSGTDLADFGFTGFYYDQASDLEFTLTRAYDPNLGRWLSRDTIGEIGGINLYRYCLNSPINGVDPSGEFTLPEVVTGIIVGIVVVAIVYEQIVSTAGHTPQPPPQTPPAPPAPGNQQCPPPATAPTAPSPPTPAVPPPTQIPPPPQNQSPPNSAPPVPGPQPGEPGTPDGPPLAPRPGHGEDGPPDDYNPGDPNDVAP